MRDLFEQSSSIILAFGAGIGGKFGGSVGTALAPLSFPTTQHRLFQKMFELPEIRATADL